MHKQNPSQYDKKKREMILDVVEKVVVFFEFDRTTIDCSNPRHLGIVKFFISQ
jgi:hypothetical protein